MQRKVAIIIAVIIALVLSASSVFSEESNPTNLLKYYDQVIDEKIHQCLSKASLKDSKSAILRDCAALETEKAAFLTDNKDRLIEGLLKQNVGKKLYKIDFYLNKEFFENKRRIAKTGSTG